jgi:hypothetical protein
MNPLSCFSASAEVRAMVVPDFMMFLAGSGQYTDVPLNDSALIAERSETAVSTGVGG